jgi:ADP-ribose pyrophosphatase YjhB (NUDIX family)
METEANRVRLLLLSPQRRLLMFKHRHLRPDGVEEPAWVTIGGGREPGETVEQTARRELAEETGMTDVTLGPIVWYGEDHRRSAPWGRIHRELFVLAEAQHEMLDTSGWTEGEREDIMDMRWWTLDAIRASDEVIYPPGLADLLAPLLAGELPQEMVTLPPLLAAR